MPGPWLESYPVRGVPHAGVLLVLLPAATIRFRQGSAIGQALADFPPTSLRPTPGRAGRDGTGRDAE